MADVEEDAPPEAEDNETTQQANEDQAEDEAAEELEAEEEALEEIEEDPFELLDQDTEDNEEQNRMYREYLDLTKQIDCQNKIIQDLKNRRDELRDLQCQTRKDKAEIKQLRICLDRENTKLHTMTNRAMQLQNFGSQRLYDSIELPMEDFEESYFVTPAHYKPQCPSTSKAKSKCPQTAQEICDSYDPCNTCDPCENSCNDSTTDSDDICCP